MTRLAIIAPHFPEYALQYARAMSSHCDVLVCVDEGQLASEYEGRDVPRDRVRRLAPMRFKTPLDLLKLLFLVLRHRPSVIHLQEAAGPRRGFFSACVATMMKPFSKIVLTVHDPVHHSGRDEMAARRTARVREFVRRWADIVVVHGAYCFKQYQALGQPNGQKLVASEHGLILEPATVSLNSSPTLRMYFFGRMEAYKGVGVLLDMAELLHAEGLDFELSIAGRGPELDRLEARFRQLPEVKVFNGFVPPAEVIASIQDAECVILPYLSATQSGVLAAAFAGWRYVVASNTGGLADVVSHGRNGLLVPPGDARALADAVRALAADAGLRERLRDGARATATGKLNWDRIAGELRQVFAE